MSNVKGLIAVVTVLAILIVVSILILVCIAIRKHTKSNYDGNTAYTDKEDTFIKDTIDAIFMGKANPTTSWTAFAG